MSDRNANQSSHSMLDEIVLPQPSLSLVALPPAPSNQSRHHRQRHRFCYNFFVSSSRLILLVMGCICVKFRESHAFSSHIPQHMAFRYGYINTLSSRRSENGLFYSVAESPAQEANLSYQSENISDGKPRLSDFQQRMRGLMKRNGASHNRESQKPVNLKTVHTLLDYKKELEDSHDKIVVVRFFATWCKACKAIQPSYYRMASLYPHITFLEVPVTNENANLHQGLEVPSLPYGHIYYPEAGLVEELKISKKYFPNLVKMVRWYDTGVCNIDEHDLVADEDK